MERLYFVLVDSAYCDYLRKTDPCVPYTQDAKSSRPFVGVLLTVDSTCYYAPLSSPKPKHTKMKNQTDLTKIDGGTYGVINFNNMIPIPPQTASRVDVNTIQDIKYQQLLVNQLSWCNAHRQEIRDKAERLYNLIKSGSAREELVKRCCNFVADEMAMNEYCRKNGWAV